MQQRRLDFTNSFRALHDAATGDALALKQRFSSDDKDFNEWQMRWQNRQPERSPALLDTMKHANPWVIPRNHQVENALDAAVDRHDMAPFEILLAVIQSPFDARIADAAYTDPAPAEITAKSVSTSRSEGRNGWRSSSPSAAYPCRRRPAWRRATATTPT